MTQPRKTDEQVAALLDRADWSEAERDLCPHIDSTVPHSARFWDYVLGGKDNYPVDQDAGDAFAAIYPPIVDIARYGRVFLARAVRFLTDQAGVRQVLDVGVGLPLPFGDDLHTLAQQAAPDTRVAYADNDPLVLAHARALLTCGPPGIVGYIDADLADPAGLISKATDTLDLDRPVAIVLANVLGHIPRQRDAVDIVGELMAAVPRGSFLVVCDRTNTSYDHREAQEHYNDTGAIPYRLHSRHEVIQLMAGLEVEPPGLITPSLWRPEVHPFDARGDLDALCAIGSKR
jgi:hypothetical protein